MTDFYVLKETYASAPYEQIEHFTDLELLAGAVLEAKAVGALKIQIFRCVEVEFNAYWQRAGIQIGKDKKGD